MATAAVKYTFVDGTSGDSDALDQNFGDINAFLNTKVLQVDGGQMDSGAFLTLSGNGSLALHAVPLQQLQAGVPAANMSVFSVAQADTTLFPSGGGGFHTPHVGVNTWGADLTIPNPNRKVSILALINGNASNSGTSSTAYTALGLGVTPAVSGYDLFSQTCECTVGGSLPRNGVNCALVWTGTPTADVRVNAAIVADPNTITWEKGQLTVFMVPAL